MEIQKWIERLEKEIERCEDDNWYISFSQGEIYDLIRVLTNKAGEN